MADIGDWVRDNGISEVECLVPDMNGVLRGKVFPAAKLVQFSRNNALRLPSSIFSLTITGQYADVDEHVEAFTDPDMVLRLDPTTLCLCFCRCASRRWHTVGLLAAASAETGGGLV